MSADILENTVGTPFFFDVNFSAPEASKPIPTIPLPDHESALKAAEEKGYDRGLADGKAGEEARLANEAKKIADAAGKILAAIDGDRLLLEKESAGLALSIARKLSGAAVAQYPLADIETLISQCLAPLRNTPHLVVRLNEKDATSINETVGKFAREAGFEGRFVVLGEPDFAPGDCRIEWADGGIIRDRSKAETDIENAIARYFSSLMDEAETSTLAPDTEEEIPTQPMAEEITQPTTEEMMKGSQNHE